MYIYIHIVYTFIHSILSTFLLKYNFYHFIITALIAQYKKSTDDHYKQVLSKEKENKDELLALRKEYDTTIHNMESKQSELQYEMRKELTCKATEVFISAFIRRSDQKLCLLYCKGLKFRDLKMV